MGPRVLVFDSGVGGLSIASAIGARVPDWRLVYLADNACFPYGDQPEDRVVERCVELIAAATAMSPVDLIVIGCNTASTVALPALRARFSCPVVGVVPAIKPAAELSRNRRIGLLATPATVRRPYLDALIADFAADCRVTRVGSSELVILAENWMQTGTLGAATLTPILAPLREADVDTVVLGCTHFPLIRPLLEPILDTAVVWVDSGSAIARRVEHLWAEKGAGKPWTRADDQAPLFIFSGPEPAGLKAYLALNGWAEPRIRSGFMASSREDNAARSGSCW